MFSSIMDMANSNDGKKMREVMLRNCEESDCGEEYPYLDFEYADTEEPLEEMAQLYSYSESVEFHTNLMSFDQLMVEYDLSRCWLDSDMGQRHSATIYRLLDMLELGDKQRRLQALRALLYIGQGCFAEVQSDVAQMAVARDNALLLLECGALNSLLLLLQMEIDAAATSSEASAVNSSNSAGRRSAISLADSTELRVILNLLYILVETVRVEPMSSPHRQRLRDELSQPLDGSGELLVVTLLGMVARFCSGGAPHFPMKKVLLLVWKVLLLTLGGSDELFAERHRLRSAAGLPPVPEDTARHSSTIRSGSVRQTAVPPPPAVRRAAGLIKQPSLDEQAEEELELSGGGRCDSPMPDSAHALNERVVAANTRALPWSSKVRACDVDAFLVSSRRKFIGFSLQGDGRSTAGLPSPIKEGVRVLSGHVYHSLSEVHIEREKELEQRPYSHPDNDVPDTPVEVLYSRLLPTMPQCVIALLKVLLAAAPISKTKTDSLNILADALPVKMPSTVVQSTCLGIDLNRQKEIIVKAISAILLLLLKHFKLNHVYQFECISQHLVFANCIPLVLKFFNLETMAYVSSKNTIPMIDFPSCVIGEQQELTTDGLDIGDQPYCWRNLFSSINLLRVLNKLCKWKPSRIMMLVVFKSAPILKRVLKVQHTMMQVYTLKLLKMQTKYLGRQWRKSNMKTLSAIYERVRHHLNDDWAFGNEVEARPWDFRAEEYQLRLHVDRFNSRRYGGESGEADDRARESTVQSVSAALAQPVQLNEAFKRNYARWLEREVFQNHIDWDSLIQPGYTASNT